MNIIFIPCQYYVEPFIFDVLRDLVPFVQFKKRGKQPWRIVTIIRLQSTMSFSHISKIVQVVQNREKRLILNITSAEFTSTSAAAVSLHM